MLCCGACKPATSSRKSPFRPTLRISCIAPRNWKSGRRRSIRNAPPICAAVAAALKSIRKPVIHCQEPAKRDQQIALPTRYGATVAGPTSRRSSHENRRRLPVLGGLCRHGLPQLAELVGGAE